MTDMPILSAAPRGRSLWDDARHRLVANKAALAGLVVLALLFNAFIMCQVSEK